MNFERQRHGMRCILDYHDFRDYTEETLDVKSLLEKGKDKKTRKLLEHVDLRKWYSTVKDWKNLGSFTAHTGVEIKERIEGGHAVVAVGYDDRMKIKNKFVKMETTGALLIRNSWGKDWGDGGYGWLPYEYLLRGLAEDFWSILKKEWIDTGAFKE